MMRKSEWEVSTALGCFFASGTGTFPSARRGWSNTCRIAIEKAVATLTQVSAVLRSFVKVTHPVLKFTPVSLMLCHKIKMDK